MQPATSPSVSLCMIVRNESANLRRCLEPIRSLFWEIIVVDTGSQDGTPQIAQALGAKVFEFPWCDDFSAARNESLRHASGDWVAWVDADDRFDEVNRARLADTLASLRDERAVVYMNCHSPSPDPGENSIFMPQARLFRRSDAARWRYRVHEQIGTSLVEAGYREVFSDIVITHTGYSDPAVFQRKLNRNLRLLRLDYLANPDSPSVRLHLAQTHLKVGQYREALTYLLHLYEHFPQPTPWGETLFETLTTALQSAGRFDDALTVLERGLHCFPSNLTLLYQHAILMVYRERIEAAETSLLTLLAANPPRTSAAFHDPAEVKKEAQRVLGVLYTRTCRWELAEQVLHRIIADFPADRSALVSLGDLYLCCQRARDAEAVARRLDQLPRGSSLAKVIRAKVLMLEHRFDEAGQLLHASLAEDSRQVWTHWVLAEWHVLHGDDIETCISAYQNVLRICPGHGDAVHAIGVLTQQKARKAPLAENLQLDTTCIR